MPAILLIIAVVWAASLAISMDGIYCLATAASTLPQDGGDHVATRMDDV